MAQKVDLGHGATTPALGTPSSAERTWQHVADELIAGRYRLLRQVGRGGMAEVWAALHVELKTEVAIKLCDQLAGDDRELIDMQLARFRFEAQVSARLGGSTKHIVAVHDAGTHRGSAYLVMELVSGTTLDEEIEANGPVDPWRLAAVVDQVAEALEHAHGIGILHRDLKPSNIMLTPDPTNGGVFAKLADFGVAKAMRDSDTFDRPKETGAGFLVGSPAYMSPEQLRGAQGATIQGDLWSLGVVAYEALTGWAPFSGESLADLIVAISTVTPEAVSTVRPALSRAVDAWFLRALAKEPEQRFESAKQMAAAFREAIEQPAPRARAAWRGTRLAIAAIACALLGFVVVTALRMRGRDGANTSPASTEAAHAAPPAATATAPPPEPTAAAPAPTSSAEASAAPSVRDSAAATIHRGNRKARPTPPARATASPPPPPAPATATPAAPPPTPKKEFDKSEIQ